MPPRSKLPARVKAVVTVLFLAAAFTVATTALPLIVVHFARKRLTSTAIPAVRLAYTPEAWPSPSVTWKLSIPGYEHLSSMLGIGIEHMRIVERTRAGWPFATLEGFSRQEYTYSHETRATTVLVYERESLRTMSPTLTMPSRIKPAGVLGNFAVYAGFIVVVRFAWTFRATYRRARKLCLACGYPIGASPVCTECGVTIPS